MFNEIYMEGPGSAGRASFRTKQSDSPVIDLFVSRITIANLQYMFNFRITIFDEAVFLSLMSFSNHPYEVGVVDETVAA